MSISQIIILALLAAGAGCGTSNRTVANPVIQEPEIRQVVDRLNQLRSGMTKQQVWKILGKLPLEDKVLWISGGSDWGEGADNYLLKHGYSLQLLWDLTDYGHYYGNHNWVTGGYIYKDEGPYRRAWLDHKNRKRIEF